MGRGHGGGFGFDDDDPAILAVAAAWSYLRETQRDDVAHLRPLRRHLPERYLNIDPSSWRSLEIDRTLRSGSADGSLLGVIDRTRTAMGARLLRQWVRFPLCDAEHIGSRQDAIAALLDDASALDRILSRLNDVCDIERIIGRLSVARAGPRDLSGLGKCLLSLPNLLDALQSLARGADVAPELSSLRDFAAQKGDYLRSAIKPDPATHLREGGVIADAFDPELDRLHQLTDHSQQWLATYQAQLAADSGIPNLKIGYNKVFGYYIEITEAQRAKAPGGRAPDAWTRKQTIKNAERYVTPELKRFEEEILGARDKSIALEQALFERIRQALLPDIARFQELADSLARLDVLAGLALLARERRYCRPTLTEARAVAIVDGRHPVLDARLGADFVANDVRFDPDDSLLLITGPNMAGKSTYIRQVALITLLAQIGSYVPAKSAEIGLVDRLFTRIGASDEIHSGQSTFMVEMTETANILNNATPRSLVILDEIGRGTSTLDGLSLAWAIAEHIAADVRCRTLFATHYHELTDLATRYKGVRNLNVAVREWEDQVVFLHRIVEGGTDRSYGIHVARLAGIPQTVLERSRQLLNELSVQHVAQSRAVQKHRRPPDNQLPLFADPAPEVLAELRAADLDQLTPVAAFDLLRTLGQRLR